MAQFHIRRPNAVLIQSLSDDKNACVYISAHISLSFGLYKTLVMSIDQLQINQILTIKRKDIERMTIDRDPVRFPHEYISIDADW